MSCQLDFCQEGEQTRGARGPVPEGSVVMLRLEVVPPHAERQAGDNPFVSVARTGLRQICCRLTVAHGTYRGVRFRQNITLPVQAQLIALTDGQRASCRIGGAMLKAMCLAAGRPPRVNDVQELTGLCFPARVKVSPRPRLVEGRPFWNNEIALVVTPDKAEHARVAGGGEILARPGPKVPDEQSDLPF